MSYPLYFSYFRIILLRPLKTRRETRFCLMLQKFLEFLLQHPLTRQVVKLSHQNTKHIVNKSRTQIAAYFYVWSIKKDQKCVFFFTACLKLKEYHTIQDNMVTKLGQRKIWNFLFWKLSPTLGRQNLSCPQYFPFFKNFLTLTL